MFKIFDKLGGEEKALAVLKMADGRMPLPPTLAAWRQYRRIPAIRAVVLLDECWRRGIPASYAEDCVAPTVSSEAAE